MAKSHHLSGAPSRRRVLKMTAALAAGVAAPAILRVDSALAAYPDRPVKIVVANTPGGPSDIVARLTAAALEQKPARPSSSKTAVAPVAISAWDLSRTRTPTATPFCLATNAISVNVGLYNKLPYDPYKDFVAVSEIATSPNTFVVKSELPAKNIKEFVALAKSNSDKFNVSSPPIGTTPQLQAEVLKFRTGLSKLDTVVFKGGGDALQALLSGTVQLSSGSLPPAHPHIQAGTLRCLAVTGDSRWPDLPNVPTMVDEGFKDFVFATDTAMFAPAKSPPEVVTWLEKEILAVLSTPEMKEKLFKSGFQVRAKGARRIARPHGP